MKMQSFHRIQFFIYFLYVDDLLLIKSDVFMLFRVKMRAKGPLNESENDLKRQILKSFKRNRNSVAYF